jgi:TPP-dependent pyruvate/acetoin dehydrogenase alpha subunit
MTNLLKALHKEMLYIRMVEERIADEYAAQEMRCPIHLSIGQEAIAVGVCSALSKNDHVFSNHRCHAHYLAKGGDLPAMLAELYGKATGCASGKGGSMHLVDPGCGFMGAAPIVGSTIPIAVGTAFSAKQRSSDRVTTVFFGEGAVETGVFYESLNFAALHSLPVLFVCENNLYSVYSPLSVRQPDGRNITDVASGIGVESHQIDGNDAVEIHTRTVESIKKIRTSAGPIFLECMTYRLREHCGPNFDNDLGYRTREEFEAWEATCPIARIRKQLEESNRINEIYIASLRLKFNQQIDSAFDFAKNSPFPKPEDAFAAVYAS